MRFSAALIVSVVLTTAVQAASPALIGGGPAKGMLVGEIMSEQGDVRLYSLLSSEPNSSLPSANDRDAIKALVTLEGKPGLERQHYLNANATTRYCALESVTDPCGPLRPFDGFAVPEILQANTPYLMPDGRVRIEWLQGRSAKYWTFLSLENGKLSKSETSKALIAFKRSMQSEKNING